MKFTISRENLNKPLQYICSSSSRLQMPSSPTTLMKVEKGKLHFWNSDGASELHMAAETEVAEGEAELALSSRKLFDLCRVLPEEARIDCDIREGKLTLQSESFKAELLGLPAKSVALIPSFIEEVKGRCSVESLKQLLQRVSFAMAQQDVRHYLNGLLVILEPGKLSAVATDGHRLAFGSEPLEDNEAQAKLLVPRKGVLELMKALEFMTSEQCQFAFGEQTLALWDESLSWKSQLLISAFPSYATALQTPLPYHVTFELARFKQALLRAMALVAYEKPRKVSLTLDEEGMLIKAVNAQQEKVEERLPLLSSRLEASLTLGFDIRYLLDVIQVLKGETVHFSFRNPNQLAKFRSSEVEDYDYVVMPMLL